MVFKGGQARDFRQHHVSACIYVIACEAKQSQFKRLLRRPDKSGLPAMTRQMDLHDPPKVKHTETPMSLFKDLFGGKKSSQALVNAISMDDIAQVQELLASGANPNAMDESGVPALIVAVSRRQKHIVSALLAKGAAPDVTYTDAEGQYNAAPVVVFCAANGDAEILTLLFKHGVNVNSTDATGMTPLMCAAFMGHVNATRAILNAGCDIEARDAYGYTALMFACNGGRLDCARMLIENGANVNTMDKELATPLMFAAQNGFDDIVRLLLDNGADPNAVCIHGLTALGFAQQNNHKRTIQILLPVTKSAA